MPGELWKVMAESGSEASESPYWTTAMRWKGAKEELFSSIEQYVQSLITPAYKERVDEAPC